MRDAIYLSHDIILSIDNASCIGEKEQDVVKVANEIVAYYAARVALLEQWCAGAEPTHMIIANFTSEEAWSQYIEGVKKLFQEVGLPLLAVTGSSESNFTPLQSNMSVTFIGKKKWQPTIDECEFFVVGQPLVGEEVIRQEHVVANMKEIYELLQEEVIAAVWPCGSKGLQHEIIAFTKQAHQCQVDITASCGPSTAVLVAVKKENKERLFEKMSAPVMQLKK